MSLRGRLVLALATLLFIGLAAFGVGTYTRYATTERNALDARLRTLSRDAEGQLLDAAGLNPGDAHERGPREGPPNVSLGGVYAELRDHAGRAVQQLSSAADADTPALPATLAVGHPVTVDASSGSGQWRILAVPSDRASGYTTVVAAPMGDISRSLRQLVIIEAIAGAALLAALTGGAWLILRRGLRPLEHMATQARSLTAGDLSHRVDAGDGRGEVGQLGLALNTMLANLESAFAARDETEQTLRQFLADAAHELRTPLTSIRGFAELSRLGGESTTLDQATLLRRIEDESTRMSRLVDDLLLLARLDRTAPAERTDVDLATIAADACTDLKASDPQRPVSLDAPEPVVIHGVPDHLRQAVLNLTANAGRHTPPGTPVEVRVRRSGEQAELVVRDHGPGLSAEALAHVFDRFWQADPARVGAGSGLGLSIVAGIAAEHGGQVDAANAPGGGAVFTVRLPLAPAAMV